MLEVLFDLHQLRLVVVFYPMVLCMVLYIRFGGHRRSSELSTVCGQSNLCRWAIEKQTGHSF